MVCNSAVLDRQLVVTDSVSEAVQCHMKAHLDVLGVVWKASGELHQGSEGILSPHRPNSDTRQNSLQHMHKLLAADSQGLLPILQRCICFA